MRSIRDRWLRSLTQEQFVALDPWHLVSHHESRGQWIAEVRGRLSTPLSDNEIISVLNIGLFRCFQSAISRNATCPADRRGAILIGSAILYIRRIGIAEVVNEMTGTAGAGTVASLDATAVNEEFRRSYDLDHDYYGNIAHYEESQQYSPQFLSDDMALTDQTGQEQHQRIEKVRHLVSVREHEVMRLAIIDRHNSVNISEILCLSKKQIWHTRRATKLKLADLARRSGVSEDLIQDCLAVES